MLDFIRIATAVPPVAVGDAVKNAADVCEYICQADEKGCDLVVFPELALTGYTCADLFFQNVLLSQSMKFCFICFHLSGLGDFHFELCIFLA